LPPPHIDPAMSLFISSTALPDGKWAASVFMTTARCSYLSS
jgi:hypothetical protein